MKVLLAGYLAKPLVAPLTTMISSASDVQFEAVGEWISESESMRTSFPIHSSPDFLFNRSRRAKTPNNNPPSSSGTSSHHASHAAGDSWFGYAKASLKDLALESAYRLDARYYRQQLTGLLAGFDLVHVHSLFCNMTHHRLRNIPAKKPMVVTLWGSDVLRKHDARSALKHQHLLNQATLITCSTEEFREIALAKFGRHLAPKFREAYFSIDDAVVQDIVAMDRSKARQKLAAKYDIAGDALIVCIGHNASPENQHVEAIRSLGAQSDEFKRKLFVILPMTYCQTDKSHLDRVRQALVEAGLQHAVLTEFMQGDELVELRKGSDVFVYVAVSDVFSATVSQALIAKQVVLSGSWLPYQARKRAGFTYWEVDTPHDVGKQLQHLMQDWPSTLDAVQQNESIGLDFFDPQRLGGQWHTIYQEAITMNQRANA